MTAERWQRIKAVFEQADSAPQAERAAILDRCCTNDPELRHEVEALLSADSPATFISGLIAEEAAEQQAATLAPSALKEERFGHYKLVRRIGQGGMGAVYEAQRVDDFHKRVALKIIRHEFDSEFARTRFQQERQLLASLEHPFIARLIDGGESVNGAPYLVLEFVDGIPLTEYASQLDRASRLRLFLKVCQAVEYAHRNLVIHRDLKPGNILVTPSGDPKLLDFGIAKLLDSSATQTVVAALTPDYASPEQVRGLPISTASDVYSLGVILYQLLTDRKPYLLATATTFEMDRVICEQPPAPPGLGDELDCIILMALRKEPERRYSSVQRFADDVERYLDNRPVSAQSDSAVYRARKYMRRHWIGLLAASITLAAILGGAGAALYQAHRAQQRFNDVRQLANRFLFEFEVKIRAVPGTTDARQYVVATALEYLEKLSADSQSDPALQWELAAAYLRIGEIQGDATQSLGRPKDAIKSYLRAVAMQEDLARRGEMTPGRIPTFVRTYNKLSTAYRVISDTSRAEAAATKSVEQAGRIGGKTETSAYLNLGLAQMVNGKPAAALATGKVALARFEKAGVSGVDDEANLASILNLIGLASAKCAQLEEALDYCVRSNNIREKLLARSFDPANARELILGYENVGDFYGATDRFSLGMKREAAVYYRRALELSERLGALDAKNMSPQFEIARSSGKLGSVLERSDPKEALALYRRALGVAEKLLPEGTQREHFRAIAYSSFAAPLSVLGREAEAQQSLQGAQKILDRQAAEHPKEDYDLDVFSDLWLAWADVDSGNPIRSIAESRQALRYADRAAAVAPQDFTVTFRQVSSMEALIAGLSKTPGSEEEISRLRARLVQIWEMWARLRPESRYIAARLRKAKSW